MKKNKFFLGALAILIATFFTACNPDTTVTLKVSPQDTTVAPGAKISYVATVTPSTADKGKLGDFVVTTADGKEVKKETLSGTSTKDVKFDYTVPADAKIGETITLNFKAKDGKSGKETTVAATIKVASGLPAVVSVPGKTLNYNSTSKTTQLGWDIQAKEVKVLPANDKNLDVVFMANTSYKQCLLSPDADLIKQQASYVKWIHSTTGKNKTKIQKKTAADWNDATDETLNKLTVTSSSPIHAKGLGNGVSVVKNGDVYAFELADGRKGLMKVSASSGFAAAKIDASITLDFKFQEGTAGN